MLDIGSLYTSNVFTDTIGNDEGPNQPIFSDRKKASALKELVASLPQEHQDAGKTDVNYLLSATKEFTGRGSCYSDQKGGWIVRGMKSSLTHYQVLGTAFMRKRETAGVNPRGGLCADAMGLGKTVMMVRRTHSSLAGYS